jgi:hypothetical protein
MKFMAEPEFDNQINFLDITIRKTPTNWITSIHRKPSFTDSTIPYSSNHPPQHKYAAIRYLYNRLNTYHLQNEEYSAELDTIHSIMLSNGFPIPALSSPTPTQYSPTPRQKTNITTKKWTPFTYFGRETTFITNIFKKTDLTIIMRTNSSLQKLLMPKPVTPDKLLRSGVYKLTCPDCNKAYTGETGRSFAQRFKEHKNAFNFNRNDSNYAKHALKHVHSFGPIHTTMQILQFQNKGAHLNTIKRYFIYKEFSENNQLNDDHNISSNKILDALLKGTPPAINPSTTPPP